MKITNASGITVKVHIYHKSDMVRIVPIDAFTLANGSARTVNPSGSGSFVVTFFKPAIFDEYLSHAILSKNDSMTLRTASGGNVFGHIGSTIVDTTALLAKTIEDSVAVATAILKSTPQILQKAGDQAFRFLDEEWNKAKQTVETWANNHAFSQIKRDVELALNHANADMAKVLAFIKEITTQLSGLESEFQRIVEEAAKFGMNALVADSVRKIALHPITQQIREVAREIGFGNGIFIGLTIDGQVVSPKFVGATGELVVGYAYFYEGPWKEEVMGIANVNGGIIVGPPGGDVSVGLTVGFLDEDILDYPVVVALDGEFNTPKGGLAVSYTQGLPFNFNGGVQPKIEKFGDGASLSGSVLFPTKGAEGEFSVSMGYTWAWGKAQRKTSSGLPIGVMSDARGWQEPKNYRTIQTAVVNDKLYLIGRGDKGIYTYQLQNHGWKLMNRRSPKWSDKNGWDAEHKYATIQMQTVGNTLYLVGRGIDGIHTFKLSEDGRRWVRVSRGTPAWSSDAGWTDPANYRTIQTATVDNKLCILARTDAGIDTWILDGTRWTRIDRSDPPWSDANHWDHISNYSTIQTATANNKLYMIIRGSQGIETWRLDDNDWKRLNQANPAWQSDAGWLDESNYSTIQLISTGHALYLLARANAGIHTYYFTKNRWERVDVNNPAWSDDNGWSKEPHYSSIQATTLGDTLYLIGRANDGIHTWKMRHDIQEVRTSHGIEFGRVDNKWEFVRGGSPNWASGMGWDDPSNNHTIQMVAAGKHLYLIGRANVGIRTYMLDGNNWSHLH